MDGVFINEHELHAIQERFGLSLRKDWLRNAMRARWNRERAIVLEDDPLYEYAERAGVGVKVSVQRLK